MGRKLFSPHIPFAPWTQIFWGTVAKINFLARIAKFSFSLCCLWPASLAKILVTRSKNSVIKAVKKLFFDSGPCFNAVDTSLRPNLSQVFCRTLETRNRKEGTSFVRLSKKWKSLTFCKSGFIIFRSFLCKGQLLINSVLNEVLNSLHPSCSAAQRKLRATKAH